MKAIVVTGAVASALFLGQLAQAAGEAELLTSDQLSGAQERIQVLWDDEHLKMEFPGSEDGYMIARADGVYTVVNSPAGQIVMDLGAMSQMHGGEQHEFTEDYAQSVERFEDTGQTRSIAGIEGAIYEVSWTDYDGDSRHTKAVLTDNDLVFSLTQAMQYLSVLDEQREDALAERVLGQGLGVLAFGDDYELASIRSANHASGTFELPRAPMDIQEIMQMMQQGAVGM